MLLFPNAKINLGLSVTEKRPDGYHNLLTVFYPIGLSDILEFVEDPKHQRGQCSLTLTGIRVDGDPVNNLCCKAYRLLSDDYDLPGVSAHLHKVIPVGAGLGGGSADAAFMLRGVSQLCKLSIANEKLEEYASRLGSDCAFFIRNLPVSASERGNKFRDLQLSLDDYYLALICPPVHISTPEAYSRVIPAVPEKTPERIVQGPVMEWKEELKNDFEKSIFSLHPEIARIKDTLYSMGALYASMSGSGSSVFGIFNEMPAVSHEFPDCFHWCGPLKREIV
jgi:4-diphosphocytidyl-2-C-methyl-D-erythritol kinase